MRPLLLDTCATIWIVSNVLTRATAEILAAALEAGNPTYVSPITAWEIGNLIRKGRFKSQFPPQRWFEILMRTPNTKLAELSPKVLMESAFLPGDVPNDPADRIIAATAREYGYTVVTRDAALLDYAAQGYLSAIEC